MALVAPYVNSYRRLSRHTAAPINIEWGYDNRTVGIRSPISSPVARRVENRVIDLPDIVSASALEQAGNYLTARMAGRTLAEALVAIRAEIAGGRSALDAVSSALVQRGLAVWSRDAAQRPVLVVRGQANLLDEAALTDIERVRQLLDELESAEAIAGVLDAARERAQVLGVSADDRVMTLSPLPVEDLLALLCAGASLVMVTDPDPALLDRRAETEKVTRTLD
jgi:hypothetical protein